MNSRCIPAVRAKSANIFRFMIFHFLLFTGMVFIRNFFCSVLKTATNALLSTFRYNLTSGHLFLIESAVFLNNVHWPENFNNHYTRDTITTPGQNIFWPVLRGSSELYSTYPSRWEICSLACPRCHLSLLSKTGLQPVVNKCPASSFSRSNCCHMTDLYSKLPNRHHNARFPHHPGIQHALSSPSRTVG